MYCNKAAYDTFIKFIPYDKIVLKENRYTQNFWSAYKLDVISCVNEDFIHVDSDVFIFDDLFKPFIDNNKYDLMIQYIFNNVSYGDTWEYNDICPFELFDGRSFTCGVLGMRSNVIDTYIKDTKKVFELINNNKIIGNRFSLGFYLEEFTLYLTALKNKLKWHEILPYEEVIDVGLHKTCENHKYTHMWFQSKFTEKNINIIKNKIKKDFSEYYYLVDVYDNYLKESNIILNYYSDIIDTNPHSQNNYIVNYQYNKNQIK